MRTTALVIALAGSTALAQDRSELLAEVFVSGLERPVYVGQPRTPADPDRLWVLEQRAFVAGAGFQGRIRLVDRVTGTIDPNPVLSVAVSSGNEQGLLGLAFHPDYPTDPRIFINYTNPAGTTIIEEYTVNDATNNPVADPASVRQILSIGQPFANHNAGWLDFSPIDNYLYISSGDGGSGGDPGNRAQDITNQLLGKMLRIDIDNTDPGLNYAVPADNPFVGITGDDEIWAYGLRNPFRNDFDDGPAPSGATGGLWIADVGQGAFEEINYQPPSSAGGENYGWRCYEGNATFNTGGCPAPSALTFPAYDYPHFGSGPIVGCSVTGGAVYRGCEFTGFGGAFFFGDFCSSEVVALRPETDGSFTLIDLTDELGFYGSNPSAFGTDADGNLYIVSLNGLISRIVAEDPDPACNDCLISCNVADLACPIGVVDLTDIDTFIAAFVAGDSIADIAPPFGFVDLSDVDAFIDAFLNGCP